MTSSSSIPVIALNSASDERETASAIRDAAERVGFFLLTEHGVEQSLIDELYGISRDFFAQDDSKKLAIEMNASYRGYSRLYSEVTLGVPDHHECVDFQPETARDDRPLHGPNQFASDAMRDAVRRYDTALRRVGARVMRLFSLAYGQEADFFAARLGDAPWAMLRLLHYPPPATTTTTTTEPVIGIGEHTDYGLLTLLWADSPGLQVRPRGAAEWIAVPPRRDAFVVNIGDMLQHWSRGALQSTPHRVLLAPDARASRYSMPFFYEPSFDASIAPLACFAPHERADTEWRIADGAVVYGEYITQKYKQSYPTQ